MPERVDSGLTDKTEAVRFKALADTLPQAIFEMDAAGRITYANQDALTLFRYTEADIARGVLALDVFIEGEWERARQNIAKVMNGELIVHEEYTAVRRDRSTVPILVYSRAVRRGGKIVGIRGTAVDITERKRMEEALRASEERLRALAAHLQSVREEERVRVARDVHDNLGQVLTALNMHLSLSERRLARGGEMVKRAEVEADISYVRSISETLIATVRGIVSQLRPEVLDNLGLIEAIEWQAQEFKRQYAINCTVFARVGRWEPREEVSTSLFRVVQEALTNVARHAGASAVEIRLVKRRGELTLEIIDDGRGASEKELLGAKTFGVIGMRERVLLLRGEFSIHGRRDGGTVVRVAVPV